MRAGNSMVTLCSFHHRFVHEYGYAIERDPGDVTDHVPRFVDPHGRRVLEAPPPPAPVTRAILDAQDWRRLHTLDEDLEFSAASNVCGWDGLPASYTLIIDDLVRADGLT